MPPSRGRGRNRRLSSSPVSRLRPVSTDPLDEMGLPSKGETRLNDLKKQEDYFGIIKDRLASTLNKQNEEEEGHEEQPESSSHQYVIRPHVAKDIPWTIIFSMRKLREALVATRRTDEFARDVLMLIIRTCLQAHNIDAYQPALVHLMRTGRLQALLTGEEAAEFRIYHILDLACRQEQLAQAYGALCALEDGRRQNIQEVLDAYTSGNWIRFWQAHQRARPFERILIELAADRMRTHTISRLQRGYFSAERPFVERCLAEEWSATKERASQWQLEGDNVIMRRPKSR